MKMSKMWKPGTSKPKNEASKSKSQSSKSKPAPGLPSNGGSASKKKLSGATMGMRFMKRKMEAEEARQKIVQQRQQQEADQMEWTATDEQQDGKQGPAEEESAESHVPQTATSSDMYGAKSDLIGRRSFGGFRPHVSSSYKSACTTYEKGKTNKTKQHISDEELLRRYKDYRSGKGDMLDSTAAAPIGNLQEKLKKSGKRKNQSPAHKGEKRKR